MKYGVAYYPEHWGSERFDIDASLMKEAGFNVVRMAEFAWARLQPEEGVYDFEWLDRAIEGFSKYGIETVLGTPTACPPKYLMDRYEDIYTFDEKGIRRGFGSRRHYCFNSKSFLKASKEVVLAMAEHYKDNPKVIAWQIDNELGGDNNTLCYCNNCKKGFRKWLENKYGDIGSLNREWGTVVWSQLYLKFEEIDPPAYTHTVRNPSACLDYKRFCSDSAISSQNSQIEVLKSVRADWQVTTNSFGVDAQIEYNKMFKDDDFVSWDNYPNMSFQRIEPYTHAMGLDASRGYKNKAFWSMETQSGTPGGDILFQTPRPGDMKKWVMETIGRGAEGILFFRWRTNFMGAEQYWHGILNHDGIPRRLYNEAKELGENIKILSNELDFSNITKSKAAIVHTQEISWIFETQPLIIDYNYYENIKRYYKAAFDNNFNIDLVSPDVDFSGYKLLILPNFILCKPEWSSKIEDFVTNGGRVIMDFRSGVKDWNNKILKQILPGPFKEILGLEIHEYGIITKDEVVGICAEDYKGRAIKWFEVIKTLNATPLAFYEGDYYDNCPAITKNSYGKGIGYYISTCPDEQLLHRLIKDIFNECGIHAVLDVPNGVEVIERSGRNEVLLFVINHSVLEQEFFTGIKYKDILNSGHEADYFKLKPNEVLILKQAK